MRIMSMPVDNGGCGNYRVRQPLFMLRKYSKHDIHVLDSDKDDMEEVLKVLHTVDVFVCRQGIKIRESKDRFNTIMADVSRSIGMDLRLKAKWVMDIDDNMELISPYSEHYKGSGIEEYYDRNLKKWLWKDGEGGFDLVKNREKFRSAVESMKDADMVTVTTDRLAEYASRYNKNVAVLPNCINFDNWWQLPLKPNKQLRVGWSGGVSHYEDWYSIRKPLNKLLRKFRFKLVMVGSPFPGIIDNDLRDLVETYDWISFDAHNFRMMSMNLDLAIIPLADLPFNQYKSSIKWYEMSSLKIPSVVAQIPPYSDDISGSELSFWYKDAKSFEKALLLALQSDYLRKKYGKNAYKWTFKHRNAKTSVNLWVNAYKKLVYSGD